MVTAKQLRTGMESLSSMAIVVVAGVLLWTQVVSPSADSPTVEALEDVTMSASMLTKRMGTADLILLEFSDFECPACAEHVSVELPRIKEELVDTGILSYGYLHFPLRRVHLEAVAAGVAAECAGRQDEFWQMHDRSFANQDRLSSAEYMEHSRAIGLDEAEFEECLRGDAEAAVLTDLDQGLALGVQGTPTFFVGTVGDDGVVEVTSRFRGRVTLESVNDVIGQGGRGWRSWLLPWSG